MSSVSRRKFVLTAGVVLATPFGSLSHASPKVFKIGFLSIPDQKNFKLSHFRAALREVGYEEGRNLVLYVQSTDGDNGRLPALAADLVAKNVDLIVAANNPDIAAAMHATSTIPIVMFGAYAPVELGYIASLARPGRNITGTTQANPELTGKLLLLLKETAPHARNLAVLYQPGFPGIELSNRELERAASNVGIHPTMLPVASLKELEATLGHLTRKRPDAIFLYVVGPLATHRAKVIDFALRQRIPSISPGRELATEGGLMAYYYDLDTVRRRTVSIIDQILKGANPAETPVEQPTKYQLTVNLRTAKALRIKIPQSVLIQANELIE